MIRATSPRHLRQTLAHGLAALALLVPLGGRATECNESGDHQAVSAVQEDNFVPVVMAYWGDLRPLLTPESGEVQPITMAQADNPQPLVNYWGGLKPVSQARLEVLRGGFEVAPGLNLSFGFERAVYVNGELVASSRLAISGGNATISNTPSAAALAAASTMPQSTNSPMFSNGGITVGANGIISGVQNTLNNQMIQVRTTIDATLSSMSQLRTQQFTDAFRQSTIDGARR
jgi:hypothetical protein